MIEALYWLAYLASAGLAVLLVARRGWRLSPAMVAAALVGTCLAMLVSWARPSDESNPWVEVDLALNGSFALIFAGAGAAAGMALRARSEK